MPKIKAFEKYSKEYDEWFLKNNEIYQAEIDALKQVIPFNKYGMEVGLGTGKFAVPFGIKIGVEPSKMMASISRSKGIEIYDSVAESLPFEDNIFDFVLMVTTICFVDDVYKSFHEIYRVLKCDGCIIIGFVDKQSYLGKKYEAEKKKSKFYQEAVFYSTEEVIDLLKQTNFVDFTFKQTVFPLNGKKICDVKDGYGKGSFVVVKGIKKHLIGNLEKFAT